MKYFFSLLMMFSLFMNSCYYDNEEDLYIDLITDCDTTDIGFLQNIEPVISDNCYGCHSQSNAPLLGNNISLEGYQQLAVLKDQVLGAISHDQGFSPMPKNGPKLNECSIRQFKLWIENGTPE